jgi:hypothetical protein
MKQHAKMGPRRGQAPEFLINAANIAMRRLKIHQKQQANL